MSTVPYLAFTTLDKCSYHIPLEALTSTDRKFTSTTEQELRPKLYKSYLNFKVSAAQYEANTNSLTLDVTLE
jgi:hypothetical protein